MKDWLKKAMIRHTTSCGGGMVLQGNAHTLGVPDGESRHEAYDHATEPTSAPKPKPKEKLNLNTLLHEAEMGDPSTPTRRDLNKYKEEEEEEHNKKERSPIPKTPEAYDPEAPAAGLSLSTLLKRIQANQDIRATRDATTVYEHNPHYLEHCISGAPYTMTSCRRCTRTRRCKIHRETFQQLTSVSLCPHVRMNLYWGVNDPCNSLCSWKFQIRDYTVEDPELVMQHGGCRVFRPRERVELLSRRVAEDWARELKRKGGEGRCGEMNLRRVRDEICALLGAWEYEMVRREWRVEAKKEKERWARENLAEAMRVVREMKEEEEKEKKKLEEIEEGVLVESVETITYSASSTPALNEGSLITPPKSPTPTRKPLRSASPEPESLKSVPSPSPDAAALTEPEVENTASSVSLPDSTSLQPGIQAITCGPSPIPIPVGSSPIPSSTPPTTAPSTPPLTNICNPTTSLPSTSSLASSPSPSPSHKRKRSSTPSPDNTSTPMPPATKIKKVRFLPEIENAPVVERPRILSPEFVVDRGSMSPDDASESEDLFEDDKEVEEAKGMGRDVEDEVDYDDDELF